MEALDPSAAVARLLEAEAAAQEALQRCEDAAAREAVDAREAARALLARADRRIEAAAQRALARLERELAELRAAAPGAVPEEPAAPLEAAVERLAARLTTPDDGERD